MQYRVEISARAQSKIKKNPILPFKVQSYFPLQGTRRISMRLHFLFLSQELVLKINKIKNKSDTDRNNVNLPFQLIFPTANDTAFSIISQ
jgi:hypothetical protein